MSGNGHHYGGAWLVDGGLVLDLSRMKAIHVDPVTRTAVVQPGVTTAELREATIAHSLHFPGGHISSVGISGLILGGLPVAAGRWLSIVISIASAPQPVHPCRPHPILGIGVCTP